MATVLDFAARKINPQAIKDAGHVGVVAYVAPSRPGSNFGAKPITVDYANALKSAGLGVASNWQYGKPGGTAPSDWTLGFDGGVQHAQQAEANHVAAGGDPTSPIYFSVDENISLAQWNNTAVNYFKGVNSVLGVARTGIYGSSLVVDWAIEDRVIGRSTTPGKYWAWQTRAWSGSFIDERATLYQRVIDTISNPGPIVDGSAVDVNDVLAADWGQWGYDRTKVPTVQPPQFTELDRIGTSSSSRNGAKIRNFLLHTQEGNGTAESLAGYLNNRANGVSYHYTLRDGILVKVVPERLASWSVLDANPNTVNLCFAGSRAGWSREQWLAIEDDLRIAAYIGVRSALDHGFNADVITPPYRVAEGISDHAYVTRALGIGTHTDVGPNFPWDVFAVFVDEYRSGATQPRYNAIDDVASKNPWLGKRLGVHEIVPPDGVGRFADFEEGSIYWHPTTHAHPVTKEFMSKWGTLGWETGHLGYPVTDPTMDGSGQIQGFQGGALYQKEGFPSAYVVHGAIRDRWLQNGAERGKLGWPISDEMPWDTGVVQRFEGGSIFWVPKSTTIGFVHTDGAPEPLA